MLATENGHIERNRSAAQDRAALTIWAEKNRSSFGHLTFPEITDRANAEVVFGKPVSYSTVKLVLQSLGIKIRKKHKPQAEANPRIEESLDKLVGCLRGLSAELFGIKQRLTNIENHVKTDGKLFN